MRVIDFKDAKCRHCYKCVRHCAVKAISVRDEQARIMVDHCINCGRCVDACPSRLIPSRLADYAEHHDEEAFTAHEGLECMECGCCSFVCPAKRQLKQAIGSMRKIALANRKKK